MPERIAEEGEQIYEGDEGGGGTKFLEAVLGFTANLGF
jgi:hypothetical protein